jgi:hypothetical protein
MRPWGGFHLKKGQKSYKSPTKLTERCKGHTILKRKNSQLRISLVVYVCFRIFWGVLSCAGEDVLFDQSTA